MLQQEAYQHTDLCNNNGINNSSSNDNEITITQRAIVVARADFRELLRYPQTPTDPKILSAPVSPESGEVPVGNVYTLPSTSEVPL